MTRPPRPVAALLAAALALACHGRPDAAPVPSPGGGGPHDPAAALLGRWTYRTPGPGIQLELVIDRAQERAFAGHVTRWMAGDVGADPRTFGPVTGTVDAADSVHLSLVTPRSAIALVGTLRADTLTLAPTGPPLGVPGARLIRSR